MAIQPPVRQTFSEAFAGDGAAAEFHFELQRFLRLVEALSDHSLFDVQTLAINATDAVLCVRNVAPAIFLRQGFATLHSITLFSATLSPPDYAIQLLGLPSNTAWTDVPPAFPAEHLTVQVATGISTRFADRGRSLEPLVAVIPRQSDAHPGNYLALFSSIDYINQATDRLALLRPDIAQWRQDRRMAPRRGRVPGTV